MSQEIIVISNTDQDPVESTPRRDRVVWEKAPARSSTSLNIPTGETYVTFIYPQAPRPEDFEDEVVAFLSSATAHLLQKPRLPKDEILIKWKKMWIDVPDWIELHSVSCKKMELGDSVPSIQFSLPTSIRIRLFLQMGFGELPRSGKGIKSASLDRVLKEHFSDHGPLETTCWDWCSMIYVLFHINTGKIYVGSYSRENEIGWVIRIREHFNSATKKIGNDENKEYSSPELYWTMRTSTLLDWKVFALKQISYADENIRHKLEGWWIDKLGGLRSNHGFNGGAPASIKNDPLVHKHPVLEKMYIKKVQNALEIHRDILKLPASPNRHIHVAASTQDVCTALRLLHRKIDELEEWLIPL